jgi:hypothetical protein
MPNGMKEQNETFEYVPQNIIISRYTQEIFQRNREKDYRIRLAHFILYEDGIREDIKKSLQEGEEELRVALPGDVFVYNRITDYSTIKISVEHNLNNIARLKSQKNIYASIKRVWVMCYDIAEEDAEDADKLPSIVIYKDPDAADINKIVKEKRLILGLFTIIEYNPINQDNKADTGRIEWVFLSPGDPNNMGEHEEYLKNKEKETLQDMFHISL